MPTAVMAHQPRTGSPRRLLLTLGAFTVTLLIGCVDQDGTGPPEVQAAVGAGDRSTAVYDIRMKMLGADLVVVHAAANGAFESIDIFVPQSKQAPEQHGTAVWYEGKLYSATIGPSGEADYDVYDPATPTDIVGATILGELSAARFIASVEEAFAARTNSSRAEFRFVAANSPQARAAFGGGDRSPGAIDFTGTLTFDEHGRPTDLQMQASAIDGVTLTTKITYPAAPTVTTIVPQPRPPIGPCVTIDARGSYACTRVSGAPGITVLTTPR